MERKSQTCIYCGIQEEGDWTCPDGHYLCENCRIASPEEIIERFCHFTQDTDPIRIANLLMKHPLFRSSGVEHHLLVAPVVLTALRNQRQFFKENQIGVALRRMRDIPMSVCGLRGECGACVGAGCVVSILTSATYLSDYERSLALRATSRALLKVANAGGPHCCKQSVYLTFEVLGKFLRSELNLILNLPREFICPFSQRLPNCKRERCEYYKD